MNSWYHVQIHNNEIFVKFDANAIELQRPGVDNDGTLHSLSLLCFALLATNKKQT